MKLVQARMTRRTLALGVSLYLLSTTSHADDARGSLDEAVALVKQGVAYYRANGRDKALAEFMRVGGPFLKKDLYLFVYDSSGVNLAHINPKMVGKNLLDMKDADGVSLIKEIIAKGDSKEGHGWTDYRWPNPATKVVEKKRTYTEKVDGIYISCGAYI